MSTFPLITTSNQLERVIQSSQEQPILLFKHSTQCPISANALTEVTSFGQSEEGKDVEIHVVHVIENRPISNEIAEVFGIKHESPQAFWVKAGQVHWHASHRAITNEKLQETKMS